jgi:catalase (peroxidase I)
MQVYAEKYAEDQEAFFKDYAEAHAKLSDLGAKFDPPEVRTAIFFFILISWQPIVPKQS